jgi:hypothetical protein
MTKEELCKVRAWADTQIASADLPAIWYQLMKLREAVDAIIVASFRSLFPKIYRICLDVRAVTFG